MVNSVSGYNQYAGAARIAGSTVVLHKNDVENMIKFLNGQPVVTYQEPSVLQTAKDTIPMMGLFGAFQAGAVLKENKWNVKNTIQNINAASPYKSRTQALSAGKAEVVQKFKDVLKKNVAVDPKRGFIGKVLDKIPGYKSLRGSGFGQLMGQKGTGAGWMAVFDGAIETVTQVIPTFQQAGAGAGFKQIAKSGTKVIAGAGGWIAGDAVGRGVGAAIGTFICPGVGTAVGSFIGGFLGGIIGSAAAAKAAKAVTGKSELEKIQDKQTNEIAQQIEADPQSKIALAQQSLEQAQAVLAQDPENKDALAAKASAEKVLAEAAQAQQAQQLQPVQNGFNNGYQQSFKGNMGYEIPTVPGFNGIGYDMNLYKQASAHASMPGYQTMSNPFKQQQAQMNPFVQQQAV